jgi:hypothetical protein
LLLALARFPPLARLRSWASLAWPAVVVADRSGSTINLG